MTEKKKTSQEEIPLHEVVLKFMFEANKERPAELTASDLFWTISDTAITEHTIQEVLNWLVNQKRVEKFSGKFSLDRVEFLDQRKIDNGEVIPKDRDALPKKSTEEEIPLHDIVLAILFESSNTKPAELSASDIYWKTSDPTLQEGQIGDVLKWLLHHRRVEYNGGKYSLDRYEFLEQTEVREKAEAAKEQVKEKKAPKSPEKKAPKIVIPPAPEEPVAPKPKPPKPAEPKKPVPAQKPKEVTIAPKVEEPKVAEPIQIVSAPEKVDNRKRNNILLVIATVFFAYTIYLLISLNASTATASSKQLNDDIVATQLKLEQLSNKEQTNENKLEVTEERLNLIQELSTKQSQQIAYQNTATANNAKGFILKLVVSNGILLLLIFTTLFYRKK